MNWSLEKDGPGLPPPMHDNMMIEIEPNKIRPDLPNMPVCTHPLKELVELLRGSAILDRHRKAFTAVFRLRVSYTASMHP